MNAHTRSTRFRLAAAVFSLFVSFSFFHGAAYAAECPSEDFITFLSIFSSRAESQQALTHITLKSLVLKPTAEPGGFEPQTTVRAVSSLMFPLLAPVASAQVEGINVEDVDAHHVKVVDKRAGNSHIKVFNFSRTTCWVLEGIEDWSISDNDLSAPGKPGLNNAENDCYQRGDAFSRLGGSGLYELGAAFFEAALENYVCAAASGNPQASLDAASLSLSGMAPQLSDDKVEALLKAAAATLADGAASLSTFYCYGNSTAPEGPCHRPAQAEEELIRAGSMGSVDAINYLGDAFENGTLKTRDTARAMACYQLAAAQGNPVASENARRLAVQLTDDVGTDHCL